MSPSHSNREADVSKFFETRIAEELEEMRKILGSKKTIFFLLAKKMAGKGTYSKLLVRLFPDLITHLSIGDMVRTADEMVRTEEGKQKLFSKLKGKHLGSLQPGEIVDLLINREPTSKSLLPSELISAMLQAEIKDVNEKSVLVDGFPRSLEQAELVKDIIDSFEDEDVQIVFVEIKAPEIVLEKRLSGRRVCPNCQNSKNIVTNVTSEVEYDAETKEFFLICENPECSQARLVPKAGDDKGMEHLKQSFERDEELFSKVREQYPQNYMNVCCTVKLIDLDKHDKQDLKTFVTLEIDEETGKITKKHEPWILKDDEGDDARTLWPEAVVVRFIRGFLDRHS